MNIFKLFLSSFNNGGPIMWPILGVSLVVWVIGFDRLFFLRQIEQARKRFIALLDGQKKGGGRTGDAAYDRLLADIEEVREGTLSFAYAFRRFLLESAPRMERGLSTMNAWIGAAPLLGLLGTVAGMIQTFRIITEFGIGNPHLMAEGISVALLTTQAGLTVAFPGMLFHNFLLGRKNMLLGAMRADGERYLKRFG